MTATDLVITGAHVYRGLGRWTSTVGIRNGRIAVIGTESEVRAEIGSAAEHLHLPGRLVVPGFQDAHVHPLLAGRARATLDLADVRGRNDYLRAIAKYAATHPNTDWIIGHGWSMEYFPEGVPDKADLDAIVPDRPVFLTSREYHTAWVNSRALERADIDATTPDPWDGRIERDRDTGDLRGVIHEGVVMTFLNRHLPIATEAERCDWLLDAQQHLHSLGVTAWQDAWVNPADYDIYAAAAERGQLSARVVAALWWDRHRGLEQIDELDHTRTNAAPLTEQNLHTSTVKIWLDGILDSRTGALLAPYNGCGCAPHPTGMMYVAHDELQRAVTELDRRGFQAHMHAIGDRAVRYALDAVEAALAANGKLKARHHIAHLQLIDPVDIPRFGALGVTATCQALWGQAEPQMEQVTKPLLGQERYDLQFPFGGLHRSGARLAMGSDWPVTSPDPLQQLEVAVTRVDPSLRGAPPFVPNQRLTVEEAVDAFTLGSAYVNNDDSDSGTIDPGKRADFAILSRNIFDDDGRDLADANVEYTLCSGQVVYQRK